MKTLNQTIRIAALGFSLFGIGCATTTHSSGYTDAEVELAQRRAEDQALARLASSTNTDIADAASTLARERATR
ncbi:MAG TPA: hypothetical protein VH853_06555 [Polyangia bacterium]|jgi:hypothetical protein|nr:hypothetical protein [Polyangia bacterium]